MANVVQKTSKFFKNVSNEMKRVSWPKQKELTKYTIVVISTVLFMAVFFAIVDYGISSLMQLFLN